MDEADNSSDLSDQEDNAGAMIKRRNSEPALLAAAQELDGADSSEFGSLCDEQSNSSGEEIDVHERQHA